MKIIPWNHEELALRHLSRVNYIQRNITSVKKVKENQNFIHNPLSASKFMPTLILGEKEFPQTMNIFGT